VKVGESARRKTLELEILDVAQVDDQATVIVYVGRVSVPSKAPRDGKTYHCDDTMALIVASIQI
jgi:hypothetical protein